MSETKYITVDWLGDCPQCGCGIAKVQTQLGDNQTLYEDDLVWCDNCGLEGHVDIMDGHTEEPIAHAAWDEVEE